MTTSDCQARRETGRAADSFSFPLWKIITGDAGPTVIQHSVMMTDASNSLLTHQSSLVSHAISRALLTQRALPLIGSD